MNATHEQITALAQAQFGPTAPAYVSSPAHAKGADLQRLLELAAPRGDERVVDVATGGGHTALRFAPHVRSVVALDLTPGMLVAAREHIGKHGGTNVTFCRGLAEALPFADGSLDLHLCRIAAHHFADPRAYVAEAARTLRSGGRFLLADVLGLDDPDLDAFMDRFERWRDPSHVRAYTFAEWRRLLEMAGFEVEHTERWTRDPYLFEPWTTRMRMPEEERRALEQWLLAAEPRFRDFFAITAEDGRVQSLQGSFGIVVACRR
ncbi:MAG TPA: methyltransferase domain-containing protein [Herpetosiphonaceae bacterium]|nr:methyltransferase domain-containing protein [Herpetosiphonaceae bacterium]